jgi:hypothetical protein
MVIDMNETKLTTLEQLRRFLAGTTEVAFKPTPDDERYIHIAGVLRRFQYAGLTRPDKGVVLRYLERTTGYSRQQLTRLVARFHDTRQLKKRYRPPKAGFARTYMLRNTSGRNTRIASSAKTSTRATCLPKSRTVS